MFFGYESNSLAELAKIFSKQVLKSKKNSVLQPTWVIVQNKEAQQWLTLEVAKHSGIASNFEFILPSELMWKLYRIKDPVLPKVLPSDRIALQWQAFDILEKEIREPGSGLALNFIPDTSRNRFQLAGQIADVFDLYQVFRPELLKAWENNRLFTSEKSEVWQSQLWRILKEKRVRNFSKLPDRADAFESLIEDFNAASFDLRLLPGQLFIFGLSQHSNPFSSLISSLSKQIDIHFFSLNLTILSEKHPFYSVDKEWGKPKRNTLASLYDRIHIDTEINLKQKSSFVETNSLIGKLGIESGTKSIKIHSCHNVRREVEVLKDELLVKLENDKSLHLKDFLILVPNVDEYGPLIKSTFEGNDVPLLPIRVKPGFVDIEQIAFIELLELLSSSFKVNKFLEFVELEIIQNRLAIEEGELFILKKWLNEIKIHWGLEEQESDYSLEKGLKSLMSGFAIEMDEYAILDSFSPYDKIKTSANAELVAKFSALINMLIGFRKASQKPKPISKWVQQANSWFDEIIGEGSNHNGGLKSVFKKVDEYSTLLKFEREIDFELFKDWFLEQVNDTKATSTGLGKGITLSSYIPYRSIPFKCVYMLGMSEGTFPRTTIRPSFDLIQKYPRSGDRLMKEDDALLFLEILYSTSDYLHISYIGQDQYSDNEKLPSILIQKMIDVLGIGKPIKHKLHGFDRSYYAQPLSYSKKRMELAEKISEKAMEHQPFLSEFVSFEEEVDVKNIEIPDFISYFTHPCKYILVKYLGISIPYEESLLEDREILTVSALKKYFLDQLIHQGFNNNLDRIQLQEYAKITGYSPQGIVGDKAFQKEYENVSDLLDIAQRFIDTPESVHELLLNFESTLFRGVVGDVYNRRRVFLKVSKLKAKDYIESWILHVLLNHAGIIEESILFGLDSRGKNLAQKFLKIDNPEEVLRSLLESYKQGAKGKNELTFFAESTKAYMEGIFSKRVKDPLKEAQKKWIGSDYIQGEGSDYFNYLIWKDENPLGKNSFVTKAKLFWEPLFKHLERVSK